MVNRALILLILLISITANGYAATALMPVYDAPLIKNPVGATPVSGWTFGPASNAGTYLGNIQNTGTINVGRMVKMPATARFAANSPRYVLSMARSTPWGLLSTAAIAAYFALYDVQIAEDPLTGNGEPQRQVDAPYQELKYCSAGNYTSVEQCIQAIVAGFYPPWNNATYYTAWGTPIDQGNGNFKVEYIIYRNLNPCSPRSTFPPEV